MAIIIGLSGCAMIPDLKESRQAPIKNNNESNNFWVLQKTTVNTDKWWNDFNDSQLNELVDLIREKNVDLKVAKLNLEKSQDYYQIVNSNKYPTLNLGSSFKREKLSGTGMTPPPYAGEIIEMGQVGLNAKYTLDYMNKNGLLSQEQKIKNEGYKHQLENVELAITIQSIKSYIYYQYLLEEEDLLNEKINLHNNVIKSYEEGFQLGKITENDVNDIKSQGIVLESNLNQIKQNKEITKNILIQLAGNSVINLNKSENVWNYKNELPTGKVDIGLIHNRPEIKYYLSNIDAQKVHLEALKADFYPSISLTGDLGFQKVGFSDLLNKNSLFWSVGPEINLPIFDAGRIKTNYKIAGVDLNIFIENYNNSVFSAIQEVNNSLIKEKFAFNNLENEQKIFKNNEKNYMNNNELYKSGKISKIKNMQSSMQLIGSKENKLNAEFNYINSKLDLIQSLGGK